MELREARGRTRLNRFVHRGLMEEEIARGMLAWPQSGFHTHDGVWVAAEDRDFVALGRLE